MPRSRLALALAALLIVPPVALAGESAAPSHSASKAAAPSTSSDFDRLMALLAERRHGEATFVERNDLSILSRPLESSGVLIYDAPDHLIQRTLRPRPESLDLDHGVVTVERGRRKYHFELSAYPEAVAYVDAIRATLAGDRAALERVFSIDFQGSLAHWTLELTPTDERIAKRLRRIRISGARDDIHQVVILDRDGNRSTMTLGPPPPSSP